MAGMKVDDWFFEDDGLETHTSAEQRKVEESLLHFFATFERDGTSAALLNRDETVTYLTTSMEGLGRGWTCLDASRPWLCYWIIHSLCMLGSDVSYLRDRTCDFLAKCQHPDGGFGGGPGQDAHLAPTYAATMALASVGTEKAYAVLDRKGIYNFFMRVKQPNGGFIMHVGGEQDVRGTFCVMAVATVLNIITPELVAGTAEYLASLQSHEGGLGGEPGNEAHGGYTFCGFAALVMLGRTTDVDLPKLLSWAAGRQMKFEGGFQGRSNKLVDGCYSFWQGGIFPLLRQALQDAGYTADSPLFAVEMLEKYILLCCQAPSGGLRDKPGKGRDFYHTCYNLSGLAVCQHFGYSRPSDCVGGGANLLVKTNPTLNIVEDRAVEIIAYFADKPWCHSMAV